MSGRLHNVLVRRLHDRALRSCVARYLRGRLLDIGCGVKPYRTMVEDAVDEHVGVDHDQTIHGLDAVDLVGTAYDVPVPDESFDSALCTAVLEHLEEPEQALRECNRVLRDGGTAVYTVPFIWHLHEEPRDFFRYSKYGLKYLFEKTGFDVVELNPLSGFWVTFGQLLVYNMYRFNRGPLRWLGIVPLAGLVTQGVAYVLDRIDRTERWTWMYIVVARKRARAA
ncbi:MAG: class I SAM-dependent methyltransferase [Planctomycetota bacterium]|jgi:SAM-dependent methyltransferase